MQIKSLFRGKKNGFSLAKEKRADEILDIYTNNEDGLEFISTRLFELVGYQKADSTTWQTAAS